MKLIVVGDAVTIGFSVSNTAVVSNPTAQLFGLPDDCIGRRVILRGSAGTIIDLKTNRPKFPVSILMDDGRKMKTTPEGALASISKADREGLGAAPTVAQVPAVDKEAKDHAGFCEVAKRHGIDEQHFGAFINLDGRRYKLVAGKPRARKNCFVIMGSGGGRYVTDADEVKAALAKIPKPAPSAGDHFDVTGCLSSHAHKQTML